LLVGASSVRAQEEPLDDTPKPNVNLSCQNWNAMIRSGDPQTMSQLAGVWEAQDTIPETPGVTPATPESIRMTRFPDGTLTYEKSACFRPYGLPEACAQSIGHGAWFARPAENGWISLALLLEGNGYTGGYLGVNCSIFLVRLTGENTLVNQFGGEGTRVGAAP
jgi:hypothetical protein